MADNNNDVGVSDQVLIEHAYLVSRGVRVFALIGQVEADVLTMLRIETRLSALVSSPAFGSIAGQPIAFVRDDGNGSAEFGYAAAAWVIDLYHWLQTGDIPDEQRHRILGLLLGYDVTSIRFFEENYTRGRLFDAEGLTDAINS